MRLALLALALLVAGCIEAPSEPAAPLPPSPSPSSPGAPASPEDWRLGGAWTAEYTQADIDAWCEVAREYDNECAVMESFPPQYALRFTSEADCRAAREKVLALHHITARGCERLGISDAPETPTSSEDTSDWLLRGSFTQGYTEADLRAVCQIGAGEDHCALMKSEPPQFSFGFATQETCEDARARILGVPHTRPEPCREMQVR